MNDRQKGKKDDEGDIQRDTERELLAYCQMANLAAGLGRRGRQPHQLVTWRDLRGRSAPRKLPLW